MNSSLNVKLKGEYKVDIFSGKTLVKTTDWFSNNITDSGILYPGTYPFARCFMFLSLGNAVINDTNGFKKFDSLTGISGYQTSLGADETGQYIGWGAYDTNDTAMNSPCGTVFTAKGVEMHRAWRIPSGGNGNTLKNQLQIKSLMVSPSSGSDNSGNNAFSVVNQTITINPGFNATVYYKLSLTFADYSGAPTYFKSTAAGQNGWFYTGNASNTSGNEGWALTGWAGLSGYYRQVFPGLQFVDQYGACVSTPFGYQMEPSEQNCTETRFYLSPDISAFATSKYGVNYLQNDSGAYNSMGLPANYLDFVSYQPNTAYTYISSDIAPLADKNAYYYDPTGNSSSVIRATVTLTDYPKNQYLGYIPSISGYNTILANIKYNSNTEISPVRAPVMMATPGVSGWDYSRDGYRGQNAVLSSWLKRLPWSGDVGRTQKVTKVARIAPIQSPGYNVRYGSMVLANLTLTNWGSVTASPYIVYMFLDSSGRSSNSPHYRLIPEIYLTDRGSGIAQCIFSITGASPDINGGENSPIRRFWNVTGWLGGYSAENTSGIDLNPNRNGLVNFWGDQSTTTTVASGYLFSGTPPSSSLSGGISSAGNKTTGSGCVYGIRTPNSGWYSLPVDCCLLDNPNWSGFRQNGGLSVPQETGDADLLRWPNSDTPIGLCVTGMKYFDSNWANVCDDSLADAVGRGMQYVGDIISGTTPVLNRLANQDYVIGSYTVTVANNKIVKSTSGTVANILAQSLGVTGLRPTQWKKPVASIHHVEFWNGSGYRLLPNYANANINFSDSGSNVYSMSPSRGGTFPGLSKENGMELYFDFKWTA